MLAVTIKRRSQSNRKVSSRRGYAFIALATLSVFGVWILLTLFRQFRGTSREALLNLKCGTCALVTNSGHIIGSNSGSNIDKNDCVFRINDAPTRYFEEMVGSKTTVRVVALEILPGILENAGLKETVGENILICDQENLDTDQHRLVSKMKQAAVATHVLGKEKLEQFSAVFRSAVFIGSHGDINITALPSAGLVAFLTAMEICEKELNVYGLVQPHHCEKYKVYYDAPRDYFPPGDKIRSCPMQLETSHRSSSSIFFLEEQIAVRELTTNCPRVKFHEPDWPSS